LTQRQGWEDRFIISHGAQLVQSTNDQRKNFGIPAFVTTGSSHYPE